MFGARQLSSSAIEPQPGSLVKKAVLPLLFLLAGPLAGFARAEEEPRPASDFISARVRAFEVSVEQRSDSGKLYLFRLAAPEEIPTGKILLLKTGSESVMAIRAIRTFPDRTQFIGKRAKRYRENFRLEPGERLIAYMKIGESKTLSATDRERKELRQFEDELKLDLEVPQNERFRPLPPTQPLDPELDPAPVAAKTDETPAIRRKREPLPKTDEYDSELDAGSSPQPKWDDLDEELEIIEESAYAEPERHWLTGQVGLIRNNKFDLSSTTYLGGGLRYGYSMRPPFVVRGARVQDSIGIEFGAFTYRVNSFEVEDDSYSLGALSASARYNLFLGETIAPFLYGGVLRNFVLSSSEDSTDEAKEALTSTVPAVGAGVFFTVGPKWKLRVDLGYDLLAAGITLRF